MSPWQKRGRWHIRIQGQDSVGSWSTREDCEAAIVARAAREPTPRLTVVTWGGQEYLDCIEYQLPQLVTRSALDAWLADHRTRSVRAKLRAYPLLHAEAEALIAGAIAWAVEDAPSAIKPVFADVPDHPPEEDHDE
jgi:hypothetical protein